VRDYIHVTDLIEAHALLLGHLRGGGDSVTLNCAYGRGYSVREVIDTVKTVSGVDFRVDEGPRRAGDPASITATGEKIRAVLGWVPAHDALDEMVGTALDWERYLMTRNR
jgi:UDP-glucose 4-epimerase